MHDLKDSDIEHKWNKIEPLLLLEWSMNEMYKTFVKNYYCQFWEPFLGGKFFETKIPLLALLWNRFIHSFCLMLVQNDVRVENQQNKNNTTNMEQQLKTVNGRTALYSQIFFFIIQLNDIHRITKPPYFI